MSLNLLNTDDGEMALRLARGAIEYAIVKKPKPSIALTPVFSDKRGIFVTLIKTGELRGCIGFPYPVMPLGDAIEDAAVAAATGDPRFPPVRKEALSSIRLEVTILTEPVVISGERGKRPEKIEVCRHGLIVRGRERVVSPHPQPRARQLLDVGTEVVEQRLDLTPVDGAADRIVEQRPQQVLVLVAHGSPHAVGHGLDWLSATWLFSGP